MNYFGSLGIIFLGMRDAGRKGNKMTDYKKAITHAQTLNFTFRVYFNIESKTDWTNYLNKV